MNTSTITTTRLTLEQHGLERHDSRIDLVNAARAGDKEAWNALVDRFLPLVTSVIAKYRLQASDANDVNQTVWLRLVEHLDDLRDPRALPGWLAAIARNESLKVIRLRARATPVDPQWATWERPDHRPELDNDLIREERAIALREAMLELTPQRRELLRLLMVDPPMSYDQISIMLGIPRGSIGPTRARILDQLRNHRALQDLVSRC
jgi:RNA polymerase sigma factor (sigma-70 family)